MTGGRRRSTALTDVLLADYQAARDDDRAGDALTAGLISVALALIGGLFALVLNSCAFARQTTGCLRVPRSLFFFLPLPAIGLLLEVGKAVLSSSIRKYYLREVERRLWKANARVATLGGVPALTHLMMPIWGKRSGFWWMQPLQIIGVVSIFAGLTLPGVMGLLQARTCLCSGYVRGTGGVGSGTIAVLALVGALYVACYVLIGYLLWAATFGIRSTWLKLLRRLPAERVRTLSAP